MRHVWVVPVACGAAVLALTAAVAHGASQSHRAVSSTLHAFVHDDASINLLYDDGTPVGSQARNEPTIPPGTYTIKVVDDAFDHNFHIMGPGVDESTDVGGTSSPTWTVTFQPGGEYRFQCDEHPDFMWGAFQATGTATSSGSSSTGSSSSSGSTASGSTSSGGSGLSSGVSSSGSSASGGTAAVAGTLAGRVSAAGALTLSLGGHAVTKLAAGRYRVTVVDASKKRGFSLQQAGHAATAVTGVSFVGTHSITVTLAHGKLTVFAAPGKTGARSITVS